MSDSRAACCTTVDIATASGAMTITNNSAVIAAAARLRRPPSARCSCSSNGQVATTIIVAHIRAGRKGLRIDSAPPISNRIRSTPRTIRTRSREPGGRFIESPQ